MQTALIILFLTGYAAIVFEHILKVNKAGVALVMGVLCWTVFILSPGADTEGILHQINEELSDIANVLFFLVGAMTIVEVVDSHGGFRFVTDRIRTRNKRGLLWTISLITFFLSAVLDNLTTTIIMISLLNKLVEEEEDRWLFVSMVIISANAGGAWTPMGDVTTTMLWIGHQVTTGAIITKLFIPSVVSLLVPLAAFTFLMRGQVAAPKETISYGLPLPNSIRVSVLFLGVGILVAVPVFKAVTHLPPFTGMMLGVGILWVFTGALYHRHHGGLLKKRRLSVTRALHHIEISTILFFLGILLCVGALRCSGILGGMAQWLERAVGNEGVIVTIIGFVSAVVDNVPLVAAAQGMYDMGTHPTDCFLWEFLAYAAGTGGSMLIIGSAAGVAAMGLQKMNFIWYLKKVSGWAVLGYLAGAGTYILENRLFPGAH
ncbi:MAG: sodium:proton antiporter NhaD [Opitutaceae bacterium]|jgi:Na+/H+ antiporter NhaD/arsenite permease-like protein|nr:sodium:proton antiporter NhaD [Opitutaceae bacterium]